MEAKPITSAQFEALMEELCGYCCKGGGNVHASDEEWDTLHFQHDRIHNVGLEFQLVHPYSRLKDAIDYDMIEIRFSATHPFPQEWGYRITDKTQIQRLKDAVAEPYRQFRKFGRAWRASTTNS